MKKMVVEKVPVNVVEAKDADAGKFYAFRQICNGAVADTGFIVREDYKKGDYIPRATNALTSGNSWNQYQRPTLGETIAAIINAPMCGSIRFEVYEFDTFKEMASWLINPVVNKSF